MAAAGTGIETRTEPTNSLSRSTATSLSAPRPSLATRENAGVTAVASASPGMVLLAMDQGSVT
jgi:hypothetical protein